MQPPLVLDIDGTLTRPSGPGLDPRVFDPIREWDSEVVVATGKAFPYPVALCTFLGIEERVIAENGGVVCTRDEVTVTGDREAAEAVAEAFREAGYDLGWEGGDLVNRWRETELAVSLEAPEKPLRKLAAEYGLEVVDTGYAYHVKSPTVDKGTGLRAVATLLDRDPSEFVAVGDSINDAATFDLVGESYAVANADESALAAADHVTEGAHADGTLEVLAAIGERDG